MLLCFNVHTYPQHGGQQRAERQPRVGSPLGHQHEWESVPCSERAAVLWCLGQRVEEGAEHWCDGSVCWASLPASVTRGHYCSCIPQSFRKASWDGAPVPVRQRGNQMGWDERTVSVCVLLCHYRIISLNPHRCPWGSMMMIPDRDEE